LTGFLCDRNACFKAGQQLSNSSVWQVLCGFNKAIDRINRNLLKCCYLWQEKPLKIGEKTGFENGKLFNKINCF